MFDLCIFLSWFRRDNHFTAESHIMDRGLATNILINLFITNTQLFTSQIDGSCGLLMGYCIFFLSFMHFFFLADTFIQSDLHCIQVTVFTFLSALAFPGNRNHDLGVASAMLYHLSYRKAIISCLDSHSDGTHSLQRIHWWESDVMLNFSKTVLMKKLTHLYLGCPDGQHKINQQIKVWAQYYINKTIKRRPI